MIIIIYSLLAKSFKWNIKSITFIFQELVIILLKSFDISQFLHVYICNWNKYCYKLGFGSIAQSK